MSRLSRSPLRRAARVCRKKITYKSTYDAIVAMQHFRKHNKTEMLPYDCVSCGHFHLATVKT